MFENAFPHENADSLNSYCVSCIFVRLAVTGISGDIFRCLCFYCAAEQHRRDWPQFCRPCCELYFVAPAFRTGTQTEMIMITTGHQLFSKTRSQGDKDKGQCVVHSYLPNPDVDPRPCFVSHFIIENCLRDVSISSKNTTVQSKSQKVET